MNKNHTKWEVGKSVSVTLLFLLLFLSPSLSYGEEIEISGFVDTSYSYTDSSEVSSFSLDQVEIDVTKKFNDTISLRADIEYFNQNSSDEVNLEQGFVTLGLPAAAKGLDLTIGKFNAPIGFELLDAPDMFQYSHALVFDNGLPTNLTGVMASTNLSDMVDVVFYIVNGWDVDSDNNKGKTVGGRLGITPQEGINIGISGIIGPEQANNNDDTRAVFDVDLTITTIPQLTIGGEFNYGTEENQSAITAGDDADWYGLLLMAHYDFNDRLGLTARYDYFKDDDGSRLGNSVSEKQQAFTIAPTFAITEGAGALIEYRYIKSDNNVFDSNTEDNDSIIAVEFTYSF